MSESDNGMADVVIDKGVEFARPGGTPLLLDLYRPSGDAPAPVVVQLHGGGWARGDRSMGAAARLEALASFGVAVASPDYRLVPEVRYPEPVRDVRAAVAFLRREGARWNLATERIGVWGASAGGHLALQAAYAADIASEPDGADRVDAVVNWFAPADLVAQSARSPLERMTRPPSQEGALLGVEDLAQALDALRAASPINNLRADGPPVLSIHGDRDQMIPTDQSRRLHDALTLLGVGSTLVLLGGAGHEDPKFERPEVLAYVAAWLTARLAPRGSA